MFHNTYVSILGSGICVLSSMSGYGFNGIVARVYRCVARVWVVVLVGCGWLWKALFGRYVASLWVCFPF